MHVTVFSAKHYDHVHLSAANNGTHHLTFLEAHLTADTAELAAGSQAVCVFVNDNVGSDVLEIFSRLGVRLIALRCTGFNNVDLAAAQQLGIRIARVPEYSPYAVAEHAIALALSLNRKVHRAFNRVREGNFSLDGLLGFDLHGKTVGIVGTGKVGTAVARILNGFGCEVLANDPIQNDACLNLGVRYVEWNELCERSHIITLHCPLVPLTRHLVNDEALRRMRPAALLINTSRGAVLDTRAVIAALKRKQLGGLAIDVYEEEANLFFDDLSDQIIDDDVFARLLTFPNVLITGHQAFFTSEALTSIAATTIQNLTSFELSGIPAHPVTAVQLTSS
jgi:D-lactate dehydrogenase